MTAQVPDVLLYRGQSLAFCSQNHSSPLRRYLGRLRKSRRPNFAYSSTACWRGYVATWEIVDRMLYLVGIEGEMKSNDEFVPANLQSAFPWIGKALPATWVSERIWCPEGRLVEYAHRGFASLYERERILEFDRGKLMGEWMVLNPPSPIVYRIAEDGSRTCVDGLRDTGERPDPLAGLELNEAYKAWGRPPPAEDEDGYQVWAWTEFGAPAEKQHG